MTRKKTAKKKKIKKGISKKLTASLYIHFTKVTFHVGKRKFEIDLSDDLLIRHDVHTEVERISAILGYFGSIIATIEREVEDKKAIKKKIEAEIDGELREAGVTGEVRIDKAIKRDPRWFDAVIEVNRAEENLSRAKAIQFALVKKSTAVFSRSNDLRAEPKDSIMDVEKDSIGSIEEKP